MPEFRREWFDIPEGDEKNTENQFQPLLVEHPALKQKNRN